jgi:hypothetical protein
MTVANLVVHLFKNERGHVLIRTPTNGKQLYICIYFPVCVWRKKERRKKKETLKKNARAMYYIKRENGRLPNPKITVDRVLFSY